MKKKICFIVLILIFFVVIVLENKNADNFSKTVNYNGNNLMISIDGLNSNTLPVDGNYYLASYDCKNSNTVIKWNNDDYSLDISNGNKSGGISCYLNFETYPKLSNMEVGSYVSYVGNNNCPNGHCDGTNANYVDDDNMGYCDNQNNKFIVNGFRIAYIDNGSVYLVSAGAPECLCSNSLGEGSNNKCGSYEYTFTSPMHLKNLNDRALTYCNKEFAYGGRCDNNSAWAMGANDFRKITGNELSSVSCINKYSDNSCGYNNDLIDIGSNYWNATNHYNSYVFYWNATNRNMNSSYSYRLLGLRPIIRLDSTVLVTDGDGTYEKPYKIANNTFFVEDGAMEIAVTDKASVDLTLITVNASKMCISVDTSVCTNYIDFSDSYTLDFSNEESGEKVIYVYYKDDSGRVVASINRKVTLLED